MQHGFAQSQTAAQHFALFTSGQVCFAEIIALTPVSRQGSAAHGRPFDPTADNLPLNSEAPVTSCSTISEVRFRTSRLAIATYDDDGDDDDDDDSSDDDDDNSSNHNHTNNKNNDDRKLYQHRPETVWAEIQRLNSCKLSFFRIAHCAISW